MNYFLCLFISRHLKIKNTCLFQLMIIIPDQHIVFYNQDGGLYFLVADTQLYKRLCPSVGWSVGQSVG